MAITERATNVVAGVVEDAGDYMATNGSPPSAHRVAAAGAFRAAGQAADAAAERITASVLGRLAAGMMAKVVAKEGALLSARVGAEAVGGRMTARALGQATGDAIVNVIAKQAAARALTSAASKAVGGAMAAPFVEVASLALDKDAHTKEEYLQAAGRGLAAATAGAATTIVVTATLAGSVVPGIGNAVGWCVGTAASVAVGMWMNRSSH